MLAQNLLYVVATLSISVKGQSGASNNSIVTITTLRRFAHTEITVSEGSVTVDGGPSVANPPKLDITAENVPSAPTQLINNATQSRAHVAETTTGFELASSTPATAESTRTTTISCTSARCPAAGSSSVVATNVSPVRSHGNRAAALAIWMNIPFATSKHRPKHRPKQRLSKEEQDADDEWKDSLQYKLKNFAIGTGVTVSVLLLYMLLVFTCSSCKQG